MSPGACRKYPETVIPGLAALLFVFLLVVPTALADGDPASDTLLVRNVFLPYPAPGAQNGNALSREVALAYGRGYRLKVAVIASERDLGAVPSLFGHPADYAKFLGQELQQYYVGPLLIVMPAGFGDLRRRPLDGRRGQVLWGTPTRPARTPTSSTSSAAALIRRLVAAGALKSKDILPPYASALAATISPGKQTNLQLRRLRRQRPDPRAPRHPRRARQGRQDVVDPAAHDGGEEDVLRPLESPCTGAEEGSEVLPRGVRPQRQPRGDAELRAGNGEALGRGAAVVARPAKQDVVTRHLEPRLTLDAA